MAKAVLAAIGDRELAAIQFINILVRCDRSCVLKKEHSRNCLNHIYIHVHTLAYSAVH